MKSARLLLASCVLLTSQANAADLVGTVRWSVETSTFAHLLKTSGMADKLRQTGPYTVFVPVDSAFNQLPAEQKEALLKDPKMAARVVGDHVIPGRLLVAEIKPGKTQTIDGNTVEMESDNGLVRFEHATVIQSDMEADNGVIHLVDGVSLPRQ